MRALVLPTSLVVTTLQLGCPADGEPEPATTTDTTGQTTDQTTDITADTSGSVDTTTSTGDATTSSSTDTGDTGIDTSTGTSTSTTDASSSDADGSSDTGSTLPDCNAIEGIEDCNVMPGCLWDDVVGQCDVDCTLIEDMATCVEQTGVCFWLDGLCRHVAI